ncbi:hypothetical protein L873DRAFT_1096668 [Choiromyces venosus 120613-1]|uniref:Uncharacterized protein n=1 Tax=Choiromyces venosus 120613-1 TaxID=1336337 RepID=A0A3N4IQT5_9PEZI|nr:hypothetical protein L873DRAFT_1784902 [Choiromyces venosus 120613-1]RPA88533.1 hypothetical protein L873DRAFT_1096668 [Choiromyces venosus 120613-1]
MDSHPQSPTSEPSLTRLETSSRSDSEVATEPLPSSELRMFEGHMARRKHFLSDHERYNPVQNMQALANHVFDYSENIHNVGDEVAASRRMPDMVVTCQREGENNLRIIGDDVSGLKTKFAVLERLNEVLSEDMGQLKAEMGQLRGRVEGNHRGNQQDFAELQQGFSELKSTVVSLAGGSGGLRV